MNTKTLFGTLLTVLIFLSLKPAIAQGYVTEERDVKAFRNIELNCSMDLIIEQGNTENLIVEVDEKYIENLVTEVRGETLVIKTTGRVWNVKRMRGFLTIKNLESIHLNGSGDVEMKNILRSDAFEITINGSGDVDMELDVEELFCSINGSGDVKLVGDASFAILKINGSGDLEMEGFDMERCELGVYGSGDVKLEGSSKVLELKNTASGDLDAYHFKANEVYITKSGSGDARVFALEVIIVKSSGSGDVYYRGKPGKEKISASGSGDVHRID